MLIPIPSLNPGPSWEPGKGHARKYVVFAPMPCRGPQPSSLAPKCRLLYSTWGDPGGLWPERLSQQRGPRERGAVLPQAENTQTHTRTHTLSHGNPAQPLPDPPARTTSTSTFSGNLDGLRTQELAQGLQGRGRKHSWCLWTAYEAFADPGRPDASCPPREPEGRSWQGLTAEEGGWQPEVIDSRRQRASRQGETSRGERQRPRETS